MSEALARVAAGRQPPALYGLMQPRTEPSGRVDRAPVTIHQPPPSYVFGQGQIQACRYGGFFKGEGSAYQHHDLPPLPAQGCFRGGGLVQVPLSTCPRRIRASLASPTGQGRCERREVSQRSSLAPSWGLGDFPRVFGPPDVFRFTTLF